MRNFAYKNPDFLKDDFIPELVEDNPCYQASVYDQVMYDETPDGDLIQCDMTQIQKEKRHQSWRPRIVEARYLSPSKSFFKWPLIIS